MNPILAVSTADHDRAEKIPPVVAACLAVLDQGTELLSSIGADEYSRRHAIAFNASIGGHYRHCLDHFISVLRSVDRGVVDYDARDRDPEIEAHPDAALTATRELRASLNLLSNDVLQAQVPARCSVNYGDPNPPVYSSSVGRELVYSIAHAIHHFALIAFLAKLQGLAVPENFGIAPSTVAYRATQASHS